MELDELKDLLNRATGQPSSAPSLMFKDNPSRDPFLAIKKRFAWILLFFVFATIIFSPWFFNPQKGNILLYIIYFILSIESVISYIGFRQIKSLEKTGGNIKQSLVLRIRRLRSVYQSYVYLNASLYIVLAIVIEVMIHSHLAGTGGLEIIAWPVRIALYLLFILFQFFQKQWSFQRNYGSYLSSLMNLLNQVNEA